MYNLKKLLFSLFLANIASTPSLNADTSLKYLMESLKNKVKEFENACDHEEKIAEKLTSIDKMDASQLKKLQEELERMNEEYFSEKEKQIAEKRLITSEEQVPEEEQEVEEEETKEPEPVEEELEEEEGAEPVIKEPEPVVKEKAPTPPPPGIGNLPTKSPGQEEILKPWEKIIPSAILNLFKKKKD